MPQGDKHKSWRIVSAAAASSSGTYGFSVGVAADLSGTQTNSKTKQTVSTPSNLTAKI